MRFGTVKLVVGSVFAIAAFGVMSAAPAHATRCLYPGLTATGAVRPQIQSARNAAMSAWEQAAARNHGRRFASWSYAADGAVDCSWNTAGNKIKCRARAVPCAG